MDYRKPLSLFISLILAACHVEMVVVDAPEKAISIAADTTTTAVITPTRPQPQVDASTATPIIRSTSTAIPQPDPRRIDAGEGHSCALISDGTVRCWGKNNYGQLGDGTNENREIPVQVKGLEGIQMLATGWGHTCAISHDGAVWCWGYNQNGELGNGTTIHSSLPVLVKGLSGPVKALSVGDDHSCIITETGDVQCWGYNRSGQLGDGTTLNRNSAVNVVGVSRASKLAAGWEHTCAIIYGSSVTCWGSNEYGQLGKATEEENMPLRIILDELGHEAGRYVGAIAASGGHTCALLFDGDVWCWGNNRYGQLGDGTTENRDTPVQILQLGGMRSLTAGGNHTCAIDENGQMLCWGWNHYGQLGVEDRSQQTVPVAVDWLPGDVVDMGLGWQHTCVVLETGEIACWGANDYGQVWNDWQSPQSADGCGQTKVYKPLDSGGFHSCAITEDGRTVCWGSNDLGQLGIGTRNPSAAPVVVESLGRNAVSVATGGNQSCALLTDGKMMCWGANFSGELGDGTLLDRMEPALVDGLLDEVTAIAAGGGHTCAALAEGVVCWGADNNNQRSSYSDKGDVIGLQGCMQDIASLYDHTCAVSSEGAVYCWGLNDHGQLGDSTTTPKHKAVEVIGLDFGMVRVATGFAHSCALSSDGRVQCWGDNTWGQLGDGTTESRLTPVKVDQGIERATSIAAGFNHTCYLSTSGRVKCWGKGVNGQLGNGTTGTQTIPMEVKGLEDVLHIEAGESHTCAILADGTIMCWGSNDKGQLGAGVETSGSNPVPIEVILEE